MSPTNSISNIEKKEIEAGYQDAYENSYEDWQNVDAKFDRKQRVKLTRKLDLCIMTWLTYYYLLGWIDRGNAGNAKLFGLVEDAGLEGNKFNLALMPFFFSYAVIMIPTQYLIKRYSPTLVFPTMIVAFGVITIATGFIHSFAGMILCRLFLGFAEGGYFPGQVFVISCWYDKQQLQKRIAVFYSISALAGGFAGFIAYGVGELDYELGHRAWRYIYWIEGAITVFSGLIGYVLTVKWPQESKIVNETERKFILLRQKYISGKSASKETNFRKKDFIASFKDIKVWLCVLNFFCMASTQYGIVYVLPTLVQSLGYTSQRAQALSAPPYVFAAIVCFLSSVWADKVQERMLVIIIGSSATIIGLIIIWVTLYYPSAYGVTYFACFIGLAGSYSTSPALSAWLSVNTAGQAKRGISIATMSMVGTLGGVVGSNVFLPEEAPTYNTGFGVSIAILLIFSVIPSCYCRYYCIKHNRERSKMSEEEIRSKYTDEELAEMGDDSPLFRYTK